ncbi:ABC transporter substrate-binding protein [Shewanella gelidii]|uniref:Thiamine pyrimidine synthase n=1 Tax=Shewanella gelidii TaxID=1642821 RepID=A0A917N8B8_9GAMM|nr:ABC transporter substrate-binding protein [Shewanella gelidii]MCL1099451.1 ABC transporter substrate-binding protein [Shewanella gelidii]GGI77099.1 hypothetical protein GCM10009332_13020 [Shewanella gelidii]
MKFIVYILVLSALAIFKLAAKDEPESLAEVTVQLKWRHQFQFAGYYAAIHKGFYQDAGLKVVLLERQPGPTPIDKLILGNVDYAVGGVGALIYRLNNVPLVALAAIYQHSPSVLISRYADMEKLRHKKIMLSQGVMNAEITAMLRKQGLESTDYVAIRSQQSLDAYIFEEIDAYNGYVTNETYELNLNNTPFYSFNPKDYGIDFYGDILLTTEQKLTDDLAQVTAFREATLKGWEYAINHVDEIVTLIEEEYNSQYKTRAQLIFEANELVKLIYSDIVPVGYMNEQRWRDIGKVLQDAGE